MNPIRDFRTHRVFYLFIGIFVLLHLFIFHAEIVLPDGLDNMATVRSIVFDGDLNLFNEIYIHLKGHVEHEIARTYFPLTENGYVLHGSPIGAPLLFIPFHKLCYWYLWAMDTKYFPLVIGLEPVFQIFASWGSHLYGLMAILIMYHVCRKWFTRKASMFACLSVWLGSNFLYYSCIHGLYSHVPSAFLVSLFLVLSLLHLNRESPPDRRWTFLLGLVGGFMTITRQENGMLLLIPFLSPLTSCDCHRFGDGGRLP